MFQISPQPRIVEKSFWSKPCISCETTDRGDDFLCSADTKFKVVVGIELVAAGWRREVLNWGCPTHGLYRIALPTALQETKDSEDCDEANTNGQLLNFEGRTTSSMQPTSDVACTADGERLHPTFHSATSKEG